MCGICGIYGNYNNKAIEGMVGSMYHRGPNDKGIFSEEGIALGMTRLAVIDLSSKANQPMRNEDSSVWIVYNGEMYNFRNERKILLNKGYSFNSSSDTEVILKMYEEYGDDFLLRIEGIFALGIYDKRLGSGKERLLLARDQFGVKPLLYCQLGSRFIFASEMKALLASGLFYPKIDPIGLRLLLTYGSIYQPHTILSKVKMLSPAHRLIIENGKTIIQRYWRLDVNRYAELRKAPYNEQIEAVNAALQKTVKSQMVSDVPLGAFLSGGLDSSLLVAMMAKEAGQRIKTFSVGFEKEGAAIDESEDANYTAKFLGTDHNHVLVRGQDIAKQIHQIAASLDQPSVDGINSHFVSLAASEKVTVAISGTGGDELFAGYPWFKNMVIQTERNSKSLFSNLLNISGRFIGSSVFDSLITTEFGKRLHGLRTKSSFLNQYATQYDIYGPYSAAFLLAREIRDQANIGRIQSRDLEQNDEIHEGSIIERITGLCLRGYTNNQLLRDIDATSMGNSLEVRVPYLSTVIADIALSLPDETKLKDNPGFGLPANSYRSSGTKRILMDIGKSFLPKDFDLRKKRGFAMPFDSWLHGPLNEVFMDSLSKDGIGKRSWFDFKEIEKVRDGYMKGELGWARPWLLMMTELWCQEVLDKATSP